MLPFILVMGRPTPEAGMLENVVPFFQHFSKMVRTCSQQVRHRFLVHAYRAGVVTRDGFNTPGLEPKPASGA